MASPEWREDKEAHRCDPTGQSVYLVKGIELPNASHGESDFTFRIVNRAPISTFHLKALLFGKTYWNES
jgi:hypothetical protein